MGCFVVAEFIQTSTSRGPSAVAELLVYFVQNGGRPPCWICWAVFRWHTMCSWWYL